MNGSMEAARSIVVERRMAHPAEKIWRALTQSSLIEEWLMPNDFDARPGGRFTFRAQPIGHWNGIVECEIAEFEPPRRLAYSWKGGTQANHGPALALDSIVVWTLTPVPGGTLVRMEHSGFGPHNEFAYHNMSNGWPRILERLETVLAKGA